MSTMAPVAPAFHVYVIELDPGVLDRTRFARENPDRDPDKPCLYVGQSSHDGETRFRQHKEGYKANSYVRDFGLRLVPEMGRTLEGDATREDAEHEEARLAEELRRQGFAVWSR